MAGWAGVARWPGVVAGAVGILVSVVAGAFASGVPGAGLAGTLLSSLRAGGAAPVRGTSGGATVLPCVFAVVAGVLGAVASS